MKYHVNTPEQLDRAFGAMRTAHEILGGDTLIWIEKYKHPKTRDQNALLHCLFRELGKLSGHTEQEIKEYMKLDFGPKTLIVRKLAIHAAEHGEPYSYATISKSVSQYTREETSELIEHCHRIAAENGWLLQSE